MSLTPPAVVTAPRSGLQMFQEHLAAGGGPRQPIERLLGIRPIAVSPGSAVMRLTPRQDHENGAGILHGGMYATVLDNACAAACYTTVPEGTRIVSTDLTVKFLRSAAGDSGVLTCEAEVVNRGRRNVLVQARMTDESGRLLAHATCTIMIVG
ncbi:PaaI family thioesterase [Streptomyces sp. NBC_00683]|uniref:PaaI family thioesterase n=1 Tax=Streptomyces sp. NBC_00683 TaxID=2903670 RepID=UPI002E35955B|nr:PaaI family thioesterase [Streptomyces sp. NBC_00683]